MKRISTRLAVSFLIVALLPTLPLSLVVRDLLERRFGPAIADPLEIALTSGLDESRAHLQELKSRLERQAADLAPRGGMLLLDVRGAVQPADSLAAFLQARPGLADQAAGLTVPAGGTTSGVERFGDVLAAAASVDTGRATTVLQPLPAGMVERAGDLTEGLGLLRVMRNERGRVMLSFVAPFLLIYGILIVVALAAGLLWSRRIVRPLDTLVRSTRRVAAGDLEFRVEAEGPGEVGELVRSFDTMVADLAEQRRDLARLERAAAWRGMARTLAHEIKNPLTPILLAVQQARDHYRGDDPAYRALLEECTEIVAEEVDSLRKLVAGFGEFARLPKPEPREGDLVELGRDLANLYGERLILEAPASAVRGWFDPGALRRALINLVDNGLAACRQAGAEEKVALQIRPEGRGAVIAVADGGVGIPPENLDRVFEPDFTTKGDGMGLGLAIVQGIVLGHGGSVNVDSVPGQGTTFTMALPLTHVGTGADDEKEDRT